MDNTTLLVLLCYALEEMRCSLDLCYNCVAYLSKDKIPYKTHLALWVPVGVSGGKFENPGYYFHLEAGNLMLGVGIHSFSKPLLNAYRESAVDPELGPELERVAADFLRHRGLTAGMDLGIPSELHAPELVDFCMGRYHDMTPVVRWLQKMKTVGSVDTTNHH